MNTERERFLQSLRNGEFPRYHMPNHGEDFTDGLEKLAIWRYETYLGSCSYKVMQIVMKDKRCKYHG